MNALVVEDNEGIREIVVELLMRRGHDVAAFPDAESAWADGRDRVFELSVLDWGLPGMDGLEPCRLLRAPFLLDGNEVVIAASAGVAIAGDERARPADLLRNADTALYEAKAAGRARYAVYEPRMSAAVVTRLKQETELRRAIEADELRRLFQPIFDLRTGAITGAEALVRWEHPDLGVLPPADFILAAESTGLIVPLGAWVLAAACAAARRWQDLLGEAAPRVCVNVSARQLQEAGLVEEVAASLSRFGLSPSCLELEITESAVMADGRSARRRLQALRELGVRLAVDDFGTGYAALSALRDFPADAVNIDRGFVAELGRDPASTAIVRAIAGLAGDLGLGVTADGIETIEQLAHIRALGIGHGQGFYFTRPLAADAFDALLAGGSPVDAALLAAR